MEKQTIVFGPRGSSVSSISTCFFDWMQSLRGALVFLSVRCRRKLSIRLNCCTTLYITQEYLYCVLADNALNGGECEGGGQQWSSMCRGGGDLVDGERCAFGDANADGNGLNCKWGGRSWFTGRKLRASRACVPMCIVKPCNV